MEEILRAKLLLILAASKLLDDQFIANQLQKVIDYIDEENKPEHTCVFDRLSNPPKCVCGKTREIMYAGLPKPVNTDISYKSITSYNCPDKDYHKYIGTYDSCDKCGLSH